MIDRDVTPLLLMMTRQPPAVAIDNDSDVIADVWPP